jgi:hypothetical protein
MKLKIICFFMFTLLLLNCEKKESLPAGKVVFYTNLQAMVNCGPFKVNVFIGDKKVGSIEEPYTDDILPDCSNSAYTLVVHKEPGYYTCRAVGCATLECIKDFEVVADSCSYVFFDISDFNQSTN